MVDTNDDSAFTKSAARSVYRFGPEGCRQAEDVVAVEEPLEIVLMHPGRDWKSLAVTMRTPGDDFDLARGFLFTEGIIHKPEDIVAMRFARNQTEENTTGQALLVHLAPGAAARAAQVQPRLYMTSACGLCGKAALDQVQQLPSFLVIPHRPLVSGELLVTLPEKLRQLQEAYQRTGGIHACGLFDTSGHLLLVQEDVGRHNAMDKLVGGMLKRGLIPVRDYMLLFSGRLSFELVQKARMVGAPLLCAIGAPSSLAIELAEECGMTLVGFLSKDRFNIYTGRERIM
ncbi:formate dehydrogenase accessory sulfurtransferase FdhD [Pontibacter russatus]|uniref:formate dehydrogenase accessory sulfurtransferase FdhD n=1 Tax=Pontibacter russatus TaxID=2694929 RepID=UPI00137AE007|nr:formate dehydrogenase accessory sulfurtransferase FdhD [Pontibacter russatus]